MSSPFYIPNSPLEKLNWKASSSFAPKSNLHQMMGLRFINSPWWWIFLTTLHSYKKRDRGLFPSFWWIFRHTDKGIQDLFCNNKIIFCCSAFSGSISSKKSTLTVRIPIENQLFSKDPSKKPRFNLYSFKKWGIIFKKGSKWAFEFIEKRWIENWRLKGKPWNLYQFLAQLRPLFLHRSQFNRKEFWVMQIWQLAPSVWSSIASLE